MDQPFPGQAPGLLYVNSKLIKPEDFPPEEFDKWYEGIHIPDIFKTKGISEALRWKSLDPNAKRPYLALYPLQDVDFLQSDEFKAIPVENESVPDTHKIFDFANFDTRCYKAIQLYAPENLQPGQVNFVISAAFTPADDEDYESWYREEHLKEISGITGWRKTERYELLFTRENRKPPEQNTVTRSPKYLTLHYFDGDALPDQELAKASESEWTQKSMSTMKEAQVATFGKLSYHTK